MSDNEIANPETIVIETAVDGQKPPTELLPSEIIEPNGEDTIIKEPSEPLLTLEPEPILTTGLETPLQPEPAQPLESKPEPFLVPKAVQPKPISEGVSLGDESLYFNMELSWIDFNWRVLHLALDERVPLLERVRFVAITASNLDEFVQKRVGGLKMQEEAGVRSLTPDGRTPTEQLDLIRDALDVMADKMTSTWESELRPAIKEQLNVHICNYEELNETQKDQLHHYFQSQIYPILTPLTVDPGHPFPFISNLSLSLAVILRHPKRDTTHFARLKMPPQRWVQVDDDDEERLLYLPVEQLIINHIDELFSGMEVVSANTFRITRNADIRRDEEEAEDLLALISSELRERQFSSVVRLEVEKSMPLGVRRLLMRELKMDPVDLYEVDGLLDLTGCFKFADLEFPEYRFEPWEPVIPKEVQLEGFTKDTRDIFAIIRNGDLLVHHPYESFTASVLRLIEEAAADDRVVAIKQTLYRTSHKSPIVQALVNAAEKGKQVAVLVEVKARFDEANNIEWAQMLENHGVHVTYGLVGLKTHTKATLILRQDRDNVLRTYCHIGTGNYHPKTARLYTDLGLFTCRPELGRDLVNLFHFLTGYAPDQVYEKVLVAPRTMRKIFYELIQREVEIQESGGNGRIIAKMNALDDVGIIKQLYKASQAGVQIDLILRGHSRLRPQLPGYSENIRVISILGRFLEHDRIFYFQNNDEPKIYLGSADWRRRNLKSRVELITPVEEPELQKRLIQILEDALSDNRLAWDLNAEGQYTLRQPDENNGNNFHKILMKRALKRAKKARIKNAFAR
ncbi:MAG: polyphosphate kinase 1 [Chloroflexi bacterium]|nr:MAG: polyphosphate kinase 1 [Chloroflexota bacterium]